MDTLVPWPRSFSQGNLRASCDPSPPTLYNPKFDGFPWDSSLIHNESLYEREGRLHREEMVRKFIKAERRRQKCANFWEALKCLFFSGDGRKMKRKRRSATLPFIPPQVGGAGIFPSTPSSGFGQVPGSGLIPPIMIDATPAPSMQHVGTPCAALLPWLSQGGPQLNPFLCHRSTGQTCIVFDIGRPPAGIEYMAPGSGPIPLGAQDLAQPATDPLTTEIHIVGIADDSAPTFPWPILVRNSQGVTCYDVFETIWRHFQRHITTAEYNSWSGRRRDLAARAYYKRVHEPLDWSRPYDIPGAGDGLRRIDYMGDKVMFRGLEPSPLKDGTWLMFVGAP